MHDDTGLGYNAPTSQYPYPGQPGWPGGPGYYGPPPTPPRRRRVLSHVLVAVLAAGLAAGITAVVDNPSSSTPTANANTPLPGASAVPNPGSTSAGGSTGSGQSAVNKVEPGLVIINTTMQYNSIAGAATGMVINPDGLVLTNNHVIEDSTKISATIAATGKTYTAKVVGYDETGDIALIQLQGASGLHTVPLGNSAAVKVGAAVVALGNADGQGTIITAGGQITGLGKTITAQDQGAAISSETLHGMIETNASIVQGDSGGPLVNTSGQVIAMDTAGATVQFGQQSGTGFAIPINTALAVARQIAAGHASSTISIGYPPFIGIFVASGTATNPQVQAQQQGGGNAFGGFGGIGGTPSCYTSNVQVSVPTTIAPVNTGTLVDGTICGSAAASVGMTGGSVITSVNGQPTASPTALKAVMAKLRPGDTVSIAWVSPSGQHTTSRVTLSAGPPL